MRLLQQQRILLPHPSAAVDIPLRLQQSAARQPSAAGKISASAALVSCTGRMHCSMFGFLFRDVSAVTQL